MNYSIKERSLDINHEEVSAFSVGERVIKKRVSGSDTPKRTRKSKTGSLFVRVPTEMSKAMITQSMIKGNKREEEEELEQEEIEEEEQAELEEWKAKQVAKKEEESPRPTPKLKKKSKK